MGQPILSLLVICKELLLRDAITEALKTSGKIQIIERDTISSSTRDLESNPDIVIYVETRRDISDIKNAIADVQILERSHWIILGDGVGGDLVSKLRKSQSKISYAPLSIRKDALLHLVMLAAEGHEVRLDSLHDHSHSTESGKIIGANLSPSQLRILNYLLRGLSNKEIARKENASVNAIKVRVRTVLSRLEVDNRTQAAVLIARARFPSENFASANSNSPPDEDKSPDLIIAFANPARCEAIN
jgi:two-component system nitrate/nitrite response regulator NarL